MSEIKNKNEKSERKGDVIATAVIVVVAVAALGMAWLEPWWRMEARAPQYGKQTLVVEVGPVSVTGDVRELDTLGHYVGIRPIADLANLERTLAPFGLAAAIGGLLIAPWIIRRRLRLAALLPAVLMPGVFLADLGYWMERTVNDRDPAAALARTVPDVDPRLAGTYEVGQFKVEAILGGGFFDATLAAMLALGLVFTAPLPVPAGILRRRRRITAAAAAAAACAGPTALGSELTVHENGTIAAAIAQARDGDVVKVPAGVWHEHVTLDKAVSLQGAPGAILDGGGRGTIVTVTASGASIRGLTLRNSGSTYLTEDAGIRVQQASGVRVESVRLEEVLFGIFVVQGDRCVVADSSVTGKDLPHVRRGDGIRLWYSSGCVLSRNTVERSRDVVVWYSSGTRAEENVVRKSRYGLHYMYSNDNVFRRNRFEDNQVGAAVMYSRGVALEENTFSFSNGPAAYGLLLKDADDIAIVRNRFLANSTALFLDNAPQAKDGWVRITGNRIARNDTGIMLQPHEARVELTANAFLGNRSDVRVAGAGSAEKNLWRGNYWSAAVVYDRDGDGVSDVPFRLESRYEELSERHPPLVFFEGAPAVQAIEDASRLFPVFAPRLKLVDDAPLARAPSLMTDTAPASHAPLTVAGVLLAGAAAGGMRAATRWLS